MRMTYPHRPSGPEFDRLAAIVSGYDARMDAAPDGDAKEQVFQDALNEVIPEKSEGRSMNEMTAAEILREAARVLDRGGWCTDAYENHLGEHCAVGALAAAADVGMARFGNAMPQLTAAAMAFAEQIGCDFDDPVLLDGFIATWNDYMAADGFEVMAAMEKAAARLEEAGEAGD